MDMTPDAAARIPSLPPRVQGQARSLILLVVISLVAGYLRWAQLDESLWLDELHTAWAVAGSPAQVSARTMIGNQSPLYFYLPQAATAIVGMSEVGLRLPSFVAGMALVVLVYFVTREWSGSALAALIAAGLVGIDRHCIFYSQEARPYAFVQLVGLAHVLLFWSLWVAPSTSRRAGFVAATVLLLLLHYTAALLLTSELVAYAAVRLWNRSALSYGLEWLAWDLLLAALLLAPALPHVLEVAAHRQDWTQTVSPAPLSSMLTLFPLRASLFVPLGGLAIVAAGRRCGCRVPLLLPADARRMVLLLSWFAVPIALAWLATATGLAGLFLRRYVIVSAVAPIIGCGLLLASCPGRTARCMLTFAILATAIEEGGLWEAWLRDGRLIGDRNQDWRGAIHSIQQAPQASTLPVFVRSGLLEADQLRTSQAVLLRDYCLSPVKGLYRLNPERRALVPLPTTRAGRLDRASCAIIRRCDGGWFLINGTARTRAEVESDVRGGLSDEDRAAWIDVRREFGDVLVFRVRLGTAEETSRAPQPTSTSSRARP